MKLSAVKDCFDDEPETLEEEKHSRGRTAFYYGTRNVQQNNVSGIYSGRSGSGNRTGTSLGISGNSRAAATGASFFINGPHELQSGEKENTGLKTEPGVKPLLDISWGDSRTSENARPRGRFHSRGRSAAYHVPSIVGDRGRSRNAGGGRFQQGFLRGGDRGFPRGRSNRGRGSHRKSPEEHSMTITDDRLYELQHEDPQEILVSLSSPRSGFHNLIQDTVTSARIPLVLQVIARAVTAKHAPVLVREFLQKILSSKFLVTSVVPYISIGLNRHTLPDACKDLCHLLEQLLYHMPAKSHQTVTVVISQLEVVAAAEKDETLRYKGLQNDLKAINDLIKEVMKQIQGGELLRDQEDPEETSDDPPDDFRRMSVIPTAEDLLCHEGPFLRKNIVFGAYRDADHYLDVQFRLLREDFVRPLRHGIKEMLNSSSHRFQDIRIYSGVHMIAPLCGHNGVLMRIQFDTSHLRKVQWEVSKRLIHGSLVCMSLDNFETLVFGTVAERDPQTLKKGNVDIFIENVEDVDFNPYQVYQMVECSAYFEAYRYNLEGLQELDSQNLPFKSYLLNTRENEVEPPKYLVGHFVKYDFSHLLEDTTRERKYQYEKVTVLNKKSWPTATEMGLDDSQYRAIQNAVTSEFSCIQGPPGTGKTYIGLKIVQLLLTNAHTWTMGARALQQRDFLGRHLQHVQRPILIVCYTNHALDQFLEGILATTPHVCGDVIRIGGRCKSTSLQDCLLNSVKKKMDEAKGSKEILFDIIQQMLYQEQKLAEHLDGMLYLQTQILHEQYVIQVMHPNQVESLMKYKEPNVRNMMKFWLLGDLIEGHKPAADQEMWDEGIPGNADSDTEPEMHDLDNCAEDFAEDARTVQYEREIDVGEDTEKQRLGSITKNALANWEKASRSAEKDKAIPQANDDWRLVGKSPKEVRKISKRELRRDERMSNEEAMSVTNIWNLKKADRWRLYRHWMHALCVDFTMRMKIIIEQYNSLAKQKKEIQETQDCRIIQRAKVIGMTTTGAAKYRRILQRVQPRIVIVEEAAEVLESHIVTSLSKECQHLMLIGDHQQLRPNPTVYNLAKEYHLDISLFERMVKNKVHCVRLETQHRMRPEIAKLIVPHVYEHLENHHSVLNFENIKGIGGNLFFIGHKKEESKKDDSHSHSNMHEAKFIVAVCVYLIQQGYDPSQITVLTGYTGQMFAIRRLAKSDSILDGLRITPVDNFQGEENDIILLSLVRSNEEGRIGFLGISNRVCVALSRARKGFYAIGNLELLRDASPLWNKILKELESAGKVVEGLPLCCQNHPSEVAAVASAECFRLAPQGGCMKDCEYRLQCGHACSLKCHPYDMEHINYKCKKPCTRIIKDCPHEHQCTKRCCEECGKCLVPMDKDLLCGHTKIMSCSDDPTKAQCDMPCEKILPCGHSCDKKCGETCTQKCEVIIPERKWPCGHTIETICGNNPDNYNCPVPMQKELPCGHLAELKCAESVVTYQCQEVIQVTLCSRMCKNEIKCHYKETARGQVCKEMVEKRCSINSAHTYLVRCDQYEESTCGHPCAKKLPCSHMCRSKCGICAVSGHTCQEQCDRILPCNHKCRARCGEPCPPCTAPCGKFCTHGNCRRKCGDPCYTCLKPCCNHCQHKTCRSECSRPCSTAPCDRPCRQRYPKCQHVCRGYCGEPCPTWCITCNRDHYQQTHSRLGCRFSADLRIVLLQPCGHQIPRDFMDEWVKTYEDKVPPMEAKPLQCPVCNKNVLFCPRYKSAVTQSHDVLEKIKEETQEQYKTFQLIRNAITASRHLTEAKVIAALQGTLEQQGDDPDNKLSRRLGGCLLLLGEIKKLQQSFQAGKSSVKTSVLEAESKLVQCFEQVDNKQLMEVVDQLKILFMKTHVEVMQHYVKNPRKQAVLGSVLLLLNTCSSTCSRTDQIITDCNRMLRLDIQKHLRNNVEDFVQEINNFFQFQYQPPILERKWIFCSKGKLYLEEFLNRHDVVFAKTFL